MPQHPLLVFPRPTEQARRKLSGGGGRLTRPTAAQQQARLDAKFHSIAGSFQNFQPSIQGAEPEQVIVFETIGASVVGLAAAAAHVPGLEWLAEMDLDEVEPVAGFQNADDPDARLSCRLYAVMTNQQAMAQLLALWQQWCQNPTQRARRHFGPFKDVFIHLKDLRRWSVLDRLEHTGVVQYWQENLTYAQEPIRFEIELWCRREEETRQRAHESVSALIEEAGGRCIAQTAIPEIAYHGVLAELPPQTVRDTVDTILRNDESQLLRCEDVMFFRPLGQSRFAAPEEADTTPPPTATADGAVPAASDPIVALFDGLPLENHSRLVGRLVVDDPDEYGRLYASQQQRHGTAMASLIVHGDLNERQQPLSRPIYVRPILVPKTDFAGRTAEVTPDDRLLVDLVHQCVRRLMEGDGEEPAVAPSVRVVNLSLGNRFQPFLRDLSPLARLLDWLAWKYKLLFLVSSGNHTDDIGITASCVAWNALSDEDLRAQTLRSMQDGQALRRPLSPAEAINVLTIGSLHADASAPPAGDRRVDLLKDFRLPSPVSTVASGFKRSVKPEVYLPGGRQFYQPPLQVSTTLPASFAIHDGIGPPGQCVAAPGVRPMELNRTAFCRGTSNATGLASRCAALVHDRLMELREEPGGDHIDDATIAVLIKALVVHGALWNGAADIIRSALVVPGSDANELRRLRTRFLGYGAADLLRSQFCSDQRATVLGWGELSSDKGHVFRIPLPPCLSASRERRRLTVTLAWLTPVNPRHKDYRQAQLWVDVPEEELGMKTMQVDAVTARRGTVEHRVFEGDRVATYVDGEDMSLTVSCRDGAGRLAADVPYAIAVTLEIAESLALPVYTEVRDRIRPRIEIQPRNL